MRYPKFLGLALAAVTAACGGGGAAGGATGPETPGGGTTPAFANLTVSPTSGTVTVGGSFQLTATPTDASGGTLNGLPAPTWESADPAKATVDANGLVTAVAAGTVAIRAILAANGVTDTATASLTVDPPSLPPVTTTFASLGLSPDVGTVPAGGTLQLTATPRDPTGAPITGLPAATFQTSDATKATVDANGVVRGVAAGAVTITASVTAAGVTRTATASLTVTETVTAPNSAAVRMFRSGPNPNSVSVATGGTVTWTMVDDDHNVTFDAASPAGGNIPRTEEGTSASRTFNTAGSYPYHCSRHDITGIVVVKTGTATNPVFTSLTLSPSSGSVQVGGTLTLAATPRDQAGAAMSGLGAASFSSSNPALATVDAGGVVRGVAAGTATITATLTAGGVTKTATATITVTTTAPPPPPPPTNPTTATVTTPGATFSPRTVTIGLGGTVTWQFSDTHNVTFSGAAPTGGNIPDTRSGSVSRTFPAAGTYNYSCTRHGGMSGTVVVQ